MSLKNVVLSVVYTIIIFSHEAICGVAPPTFLFKQLKQEDGLSSENIGFRGNAVLRDRQGFMWFATFEGLDRFDGYRFRNIGSASDNSGPSDNIIHSLFEDRDGFIWVGTYSGLDRYDPATESFLHIKTETVNGKKALFLATTQDKNGNIWASTSTSGIYRINPQNLAIKKYDYSAEKPNEPKAMLGRSSIATADGKVWFASSKGIKYYSPANDKLHNIPLSDPSTKDSIPVNTLYLDEDGRMWAGSDRGLYTFHTQSGKYTQWEDSNGANPLGKFKINDIAKDGEGNFWLATPGNGLITFSPETGNVRAFHRESDKQRGIDTNQVFDIYIDDFQTLWIGTNQGLVYSSLHAQSFSFFPNFVNSEKTLSERPVTSLLITREGEQWVGSFEGGVSRTTAQGSRHHYHASDILQNGLSSNSVFALHEDRNSTIWLGTSKGGLLRYDRQQDKFIAIDSPNTIIHIKEDSHGTLWFGTLRKGIWFLRAGDETVQEFKNSSIAKGSISALHVDSQDQIWAGTTNGLFVFNLESNDHRHYSPSVPENALAHLFILSLHESIKEGQMWIGTAGGLSRLDMASDNIRNYKKGQGLPGNIVSSIQEDALGRLWIGTNFGITLLDPVTSHIINFKKEDGLREVDFTQNAYAKNVEGHLQFGSATGYTEFNPLEIESNFTPPRLLITGFRVFNQVVDIQSNENQGRYTIPRSISLLDKLELSHRENFFSFEFSALDAIEPRNVAYSYMLEGWDNHWISTNYENRIASYTNIPAGEYQLKIKARDQAGIWRTSSSPLRITITPPIWKTSAAYFLYFLVVIAAIMLTIKIRTKHLESRAKQLNIAVKERTNEVVKQKKTIEELMHKKDELFTNISHEFRTPLTLILGPVEDLINQDKNNKQNRVLNQVIANGKRLLRMVDQLLDLTRLDKTSSPPGKYINASKLLEEIAAYFTPALQEKNLTLNLAIEDEVFIFITPDALEKIFANLLSNAIKYSFSSGKIEVTCKASGNSALISVKDEGPGIQREDHQRIFERYVRLEQCPEGRVPGAGIGLALVKQLTEHHKGSILLRSLPGQGSSFSLSFPLTQTDGGRYTVHPNIALDLEAASAQYFHIAENEKKLTQTDYISRENSPLPKVLVVEDHTEMRSYLVEALQGDYECFSAEDGVIGEQQALKVIPDLIVTDLMMPRMNGFEFAEKIRSDIKTSHIPILMLTAKTDLNTRKTAWQTDIDEYIEKPFNTEELRLRCNNLLSIRKILSRRLTQDINTNPQDHQEILRSRDKLFVEKLQGFLAKHFQNPDLGAKMLCNALAMSESQLQRKMKGLLNQSVPEFIRSYRLKQSLKLLRSGVSISEIAFSIGFSNPTYFSRCFKAEFDQSPKAMRDTFNQQAGEKKPTMA